MAATDPVITLAAALKLEAPGGDVRLCDGGMLSFGGEGYASHDPVFGSIKAVDALSASFGDATEDWSLTFAPASSANVGDWWRGDLANCRLRGWMLELDSDGYTGINGEQVADLLVDSIERVQGAAGEDVLKLGFIGRPEKLFMRNEGNRCTQTFHQSVWPGATDENGFRNCTDLKGFVAWGAASPPRGGASGATA